MNTYANKPMPFGIKVKKLFKKQFYLSPRDYAELIHGLETGQPMRMRDVVNFVDDNGEWLDG